MGLSVGVLVLVSTANWQGTQPHSTRFTTAHSIEFDLVNFILYILVVGGRELVKLLLLRSRCRCCRSRGVDRGDAQLITVVSLARNGLVLNAGLPGRVRYLPPFILSLSLSLCAATAPVPAVSGAPSPFGFGAAVIGAPSKT